MKDTLSRFNSLATLRETEIEPAAGLRVRVRELTVAQRVEYGRIVRESNTDAGVVYMLRSCVRDPETGSPLFPEDYQFENISPGILEHMARAVLEVSGLIKGEDSGN